MARRRWELVAEYSAWRAERKRAALEAWRVLDQKVADLFKSLPRLRSRAVHFNPATYASTRDDALAAITCHRNIIEKQFGGSANLLEFLQAKPATAGDAPGP